jgi:hypothetical protein
LTAELGHEDRAAALGRGVPGSREPVFVFALDPPVGRPGSPTLTGRPTGGPVTTTSSRSMQLLAADRHATGDSSDNRTLANRLVDVLHGRLRHRHREC